MMQLPSVAEDFQRYAKEHTNLEEIASAYKKYKEAVK